MYISEVNVSEEKFSQYGSVKLTLEKRTKYKQKRTKYKQKIYMPTAMQNQILIIHLTLRGC